MDSAGNLIALEHVRYVMLTADGRVAYTQLVPEITDEPDYEAALEALKSLN